MAEPRTSTESSSVGGFCTVGDQIGYCTGRAEDGESSLVQFFDAPGNIRIESISNLEMRAYVLPRQTRVWVAEGTTWRIGRIVAPPDEGADFYLVALPGNEGRQLAADQFHVVSGGRPADPLTILEAKVAAEAFFFERRARFVTEMLRLRAAAEGMDGILSSSIRFHRHQICAARQVLADPTRRYLLADEVGLGKTIEAGMIVRQSMLDTPGTRARILVPDPLASQWQEELANKFRLDGLNGGSVTISTHGEFRLSPLDMRVGDLLVVDEAHQLTQDPFDADVFAQLAANASAASTVLLLSATPVRSNELAFLRLLHLLDPVSYQLDDAEGFRARVASRDAVSKAVSLLDDTEYRFMVREGCEVLAERFTDDAHLVELLDELKRSLEGEDDVMCRELALRTKSYVSDTYRLHRRMIRTRRNARIQVEFPVRQRTRHHEWLVPVTDPDRTHLIDALDELRLQIAAMSHVSRPGLLALLGSRLTSSVEALEPIIGFLADGEVVDVSKDETVILSGIADNSDRERILERLRSVRVRVLASNARFDAVTSWVRAHLGRSKVAICTSFSPTARALADHLEDRLGVHRVARLIQGMRQLTMNDEVGRARGDQHCTALICDSVAEEGWNLQFVDHVLHFDLPWSANRLEQRLGRFDRYLPEFASARAVTSSVLTDGDRYDRISGTWRRFHDEAVDLFERSAATLQYVLPDVEREFVEQIVEQGFGGVAESIPSIGERLSEERQIIENQDVFDSLEDTADGQRFFEELLESDERPEAIESVITGWIGDSLQFTVNNYEEDVKFGISTKRPPLLPEPIIRRIGIDNFGVKYAFDRWTAEGRAMARPGDPLIDGLLHASLEDDRGLVFARVRRVEGASLDMPTHPVFRFHYVLGPNPTPLGGTDRVTGSALMRQAMRYLPSSMEEVWVDLGPSNLTPEIIEELRSAPSQGLGNDPELWEQLVAGFDWPATCRRAEKYAYRTLVERRNTTDRIARGLARLDAEIEARRTQQIVRARSLGETADIDQLDDVHRVLTSSISKPSVRLDACGVILLAPWVLGS